jgi:hypothetical protein
MYSKAIAYWHKYGWRLTLALLLSLLLHAFLLGGLALHMPTFTNNDRIVQVQLAPVMQAKPPQKAAKVIAQPVKKAKPKPKPEPPPLPEPPPQTLPVEAPTPTPEVAAHPPLPDTSLPPSDEALAGTDNAAEQAVPADEPAESDEPMAVIRNQSSYVDMDFDVFRNGDSSTIGTAHITYKQLEDGSYKLISTTEARGLIALFVSGQLLQTSEGKVTNYGLRPEHYSFDISSKAGKLQNATFDWDTHVLTMQTAKRSDTVPLAEGTQDLLSIMFQFMFVPPLQQMQLSFTNGKRLSTYHYQFAGEEDLKTKLGVLRTLHIYRTGEADDKLDLWLAVDYRFLPVKIGKTEKDGSSYVQVVSRLSTDILK